MKWRDLKIRFPKDLYIELKIEAASRKKSLAAIVREKIIESFDDERKVASIL